MHRVPERLTVAPFDTVQFRNCPCTCINPTGHTFTLGPRTLPWPPPSVRSPSPAPPPYVAPSRAFRIDIVPDSKPDEISWLLEQASCETCDDWAGKFTGRQPENGKPWIWRFRLNYGRYRWTIKDSAQNGICCASGNGFYELSVDDVLVAQGAQFGPSRAHELSVNGMPHPPPAAPRLPPASPFAPPSAPPSPPSPPPPGKASDAAAFVGDLLGSLPAYIGIGMGGAAFVGLAAYGCVRYTKRRRMARLLRAAQEEHFRDGAVASTTDNAAAAAGNGKARAQRGSAGGGGGGGKASAPPLPDARQRQLEAMVGSEMRAARESARPPDAVESDARGGARAASRAAPRAARGAPVAAARASALPPRARDGRA